MCKVFCLKQPLNFANSPAQRVQHKMGKNILSLEETEFIVHQHKHPSGELESARDIKMTSNLLQENKKMKTICRQDRLDLSKSFKKKNGGVDLYKD